MRQRKDAENPKRSSGGERQPKEARDQNRLHRESNSGGRQQAHQVCDRVQRHDLRSLAPGNSPLGIQPVADRCPCHHGQGKAVGECVAQKGSVGRAPKR